MAVYKVPQDVEADDKLIGPFTFRQFIFLLALVGFVYLAYVLMQINFIMVAIPLPIIVFLAALAFPWRKDQPTEVYLTALIHFWTKPRKRIWNQEGHVEHVVISAPLKVEHTYTDGMTNTEVRSRLQNLASTLDTRGWASKNIDVPDVSGQQQPSPQQQAVESDRLVMPMVTQRAPGPQAVTDKDDVLDVNNNPVAQNFDNLVNKAAEDHKAEVLQQMQSVADEPAANSDLSTPGFDPYPNDMQQAVISPASNPAQNDQNQPVKSDAQNAIINLANNSDLNVSTIARQADQAMQSGDTIELH